MDGIQKSQVSEQVSEPTPEQGTLPLEDVGERDVSPIPFALTAKAKRAVAPSSLPPLSVVDESTQPSLGEESGEELREEADDGTRRARARALRHAGVTVGDIATELDVDELLVRAWVSDVSPVHSARRRLRSVPDGRAPRQQGRRSAVLEHEQVVQSFEHARTEATAEAGDRVGSDPGFTSGLGLISGIAEIGPHAVVLTTRDADVAAAALRWLRRTMQIDPARIRTVLRVPPQLAADIAAHRWAEAVGIASERIVTARWSAAPDGETVEALIRIADPRVAGRLAGWRDALLGAVTSGDAAF